MQFLDDLLYFGTGDGGSGGDPPNNAQNKEVLLGKLLRIDPRPAGGAALLGARLATPSSAGPAATRSTATACATRSASPSTRSAPRSRGSRSATSARTGSRSSTTRRSRRRAAPTSAGTPSRASPPTRKKTAAPPTPAAPTKPIFAYPHSRGGSCSIIGGYVVRDRGLPSLYKRYVYADLCEGQLRSLVPHLKRAQRRPQARPRGRKPDLLRRRRRPPPLRRLARGPGLPPRPKVTLLWQFANTPSQRLVYSGIIMEAMRDRLDRRSHRRPRQARWTQGSRRSMTTSREISRRRQQGITARHGRARPRSRAETVRLSCTPRSTAVDAPASTEIRTVRHASNRRGSTGLAPATLIDTLWWR